MIIIHHTQVQHTKHTNSEAVRLLLRDIVAPLKLSPWLLDETRPPFKLHPHELYVSFSHSGKIIGCAVGDLPAIGFDIETRPITLAIAQRFFSPLENEALDYQYANNLADATQLRTRLWMLKEAYIKASWRQNPTSLFAGLKICMVHTLGANALELHCNRWQFNDWHIRVDGQVPLAAIYKTNDS